MTPLASYVVETVITLLAVIALAVLVLYGARRVGVGRPAGPVRLVGRLPLDGRRAVYLVRVSDKIYVLGASEAGLNKLGELSADGLCLGEEGTPRSFFSVLSGLLDRKPPGRVTRRDEQ
jgi:flagellar biogenesis protein FliO